MLAEYWGKPAFIRIIKEEFVLEMWLRMAALWMLFKTYPIAGMSGDLVPGWQYTEKVQAPYPDTDN